MAAFLIGGGLLAGGLFAASNNDELEKFEKAFEVFLASAGAAAGNNNGGNGGKGGKGNQTVQSGGKTIRDSSAKQLNDYSGKNYSPRDWSRTLERIKNESGFGNNYHEGKITLDGPWYDGKGIWRGNLNQILP